MRRLRWTGLVAAITLIAVLTLTPGSPASYQFLAGLLEPWIGPQRLAVALNVLLFVPLGLVIGWFRRPWLLLAAVGASVVIELTQLLIPDRNTLLSDVITNSVGACLGYGLMVGARRWLRARTSSGHHDQMQR